MIGPGHLLTVVGQHFLASFSQFFAMILQACQDLKCVGNGIGTKPDSVRTASGLLFRRAAKWAPLRVGCLLWFGRDGCQAKGQHYEESGANSVFHCLCLNVYASLHDNSGVQ